MKYPSIDISYEHILWHLVTQENVPTLPQVSTPGVSASVLLAASYSDNNAIIEGLASYTIVTIHNIGLAGKKILLEMLKK